MQDPTQPRDPSFRAWVAFVVPALLWCGALNAILFEALAPVWASLDVERARWQQGTLLLGFLFSLPISFWCFRRALERHVFPRLQDGPRRPGSGTRAAGADT